MELIFLLLLAGCCKAHTVYFYDSNKEYVTAEKSDAIPDPAIVIEYFRGMKAIIPESSVWKNFGKYSEELLNGMTEMEHIDVIAAFLSNVSGKRSHLQYQQFASKISNDGISQIRIRKVWEHTKAFIKSFKRDQTRYFSSDLLNDLLKNGQFNSVMNHIHHSIFVENADLIISSIHDGLLKSSLGHFPIDALSKILRGDECSSLLVSDILSLGERRKKAEKLSAECAALLDWSEAVCDRRLKFLPENVFSLVEGAISPSCLHQMTIKQFGQLRKGLVGTKTEKCQDLMIENLDISVLEAVDGECLNERLENDRLKLGHKWPLLSKTIFSKTNKEWKLDSIHKKDWKHISAAKKQRLFEYLDACENVPKEAFTINNRGLVINEGCFESLDDDVKGFALIYARIPDNALAKQKDLSILKATDPEGNEINGLDLFKHTLHLLNISKLIESIPCDQFDSLEKVLENRVIQRFFRKECLASLDQQPTNDHLEHLNTRFAKLVGLEAERADKDEKDK